MAYVSVVFVLLGMLLGSARGQGSTCDQYNNFCVNGVCELQANQLAECTCHPGFILDPVNPLQCHPVPSCNFLQGTPDQQCLNGVCQQQATGTFGCTCYPGYQLSLVNPNICENVDECTLPYTGCAPGSCTDVIGDYSCTSCMRGYILDQRGRCQRIIVNQPASQVRQRQSDPSHLLVPWMMDSMFF